MSEKDTGKTVYFTLNPEKPPTMTEDQWKRFDAIRDEDIDYSDDRDLSQNGTSVPISSDILNFFREKGDASPQRINEVLREYIAAHRKVA